MNRLNKHIFQEVKDRFYSFIRVTEEVSKLLKKEFKVLENDADGLNFELDGIAFTLTWSNEEGTPKIKYQLYVWHTTWGSRINPPEHIDTLVVESEDIAKCNILTFTTVMQSELDGALTSIAENQTPTEEM